MVEPLEIANSSFVSPHDQDGILLGAVGAYDWNGAVLKETSSGKVVPHRESYLQEFPEELKNHGAYLGKRNHQQLLGKGSGSSWFTQAVLPFWTSDYAIT